ncbi:MAG: hypothetical protein ACOC06_06260 [Halorubrum sp.]
MATSQTTFEEVSDAQPQTTTTPATIDQAYLSSIVAQTTGADDLPDWEVYNAACKLVRDSVEAAIAEEVH